jgi:cobalt-zinc-cadmium efflux system outer membrane protein
MVIAILCLAAMLAASASEARLQVSEQAFLDTIEADARVKAILSERLTAAQAELDRAGLIPNPEGSWEREAPSGIPPQVTWALSWAPPIDGRLGLRKGAARAGLRAAELDYEISRVALRSEVRGDFADWSFAYERAGLTARLADLVDRLATQVSEHADRGEVSGLSARRLTLASIEVRAEAARAAAELERARAAVMAWAPDLVGVAEPQRPPLPPVPPDTILTMELPTIEARRLEIEQAELTTRVAKRFWAMPELTFGWQTIKGDQVQLDGPVFGVQWPLPLFDRQQGERTEAAGRAAAARGRYELISVRARAELAASRAAYEKLHVAAESALDAEAAGGQVIASAVAKFEAGESDVTDLLETLRGALSGWQAVFDLHAAALEGHRALEIAAGRALTLEEGETR